MHGLVITILSLEQVSTDLNPQLLRNRVQLAPRLHAKDLYAYMLFAYIRNYTLDQALHSAIALAGAMYLFERYRLDDTDFSMGSPALARLVERAALGAWPQAKAEVETRMEEIEGQIAHGNSYASITLSSMSTVDASTNHTLDGELCPGCVLLFFGALYLYELQSPRLVMTF